MQDMTMVISNGRNPAPVVLSPAPAPSLSTEQLLEAKLTLARALQRSLEPSRVGEYFFRFMQPLVTVTGMKLEMDAGIDESWQFGRDSLHSCNYRLNPGDEFIGSITFYRAKRFSEAEQSELESLLALLIMPLNNAVQYHKALKMTLIDPLTGLGNRIALDHSLGRDLRLAQRFNTPFSLLIIDIDHFKLINDRFGHRCGDEVLKAVATALSSACRSSDACYRYGGEEFLVLLPATSGEGAKIIAARILELITSLKIERDLQLITPTVSIGIASTNESDLEGTSELFERADKALYRAKSDGRNCIRAA